TRYDPAAASLVEQLTREDYRPVISELGHYNLLTNIKGASGDASVQRRLARMEDTYQGFFYWFALKGRPLPLPNHRLVPTPRDTRAGSKEFESKRAFFDQVPMVADGFTARRDNVVVMASTRQDEAYRVLVKYNKDMQSTLYQVSADAL